MFRDQYVTDLEVVSLLITVRYTGESALQRKGDVTIKVRVRNFANDVGVKTPEVTEFEAEANIVK